MFLFLVCSLLLTSLVSDSFHLLSASLLFPFSFTTRVLFVLAASVTFSTFFLVDGAKWLSGYGGRLLSVKGVKEPVKQRVAVCWQGRQETQIS